ncbi:GNAT family N-acetyltransferase [Novosphingobium sp. JCM 18896]|uniref:GNAT family N-acetyltransferase n=1 Tax=Novosphingobium sp. JCM 18896 TaxID=2989731 RepID=UPI002222285A|nr:GNAT family N-acetyltransferase [Novosphingobium sp. JCM 18896]MCW1429294.1 GNAT family N-acetyltransferase [Novosphingobium sp. JCM 18896]
MIETDRLLVRRWRDSDRAPFWAMAQDPEVMRFLLPIASRAESDSVVDRLITAQANHGHCFWAVERKQDGRFLGFCGLMAPRAPLRETEIGWRLARDAWGQGYAREAAEACLDWAWRELRAKTVVAITVSANERSWGLMERLGMTRDPDADFDHPAVPDGDPLKRHMLYRIARPQ